MPAGIWQSRWHVVLMIFSILSTSVVWCNLFTDHYAVQLDGGVDEAQRIAAQHGFVFVNEVQFCYHFNSSASRSAIGFVLCV